MFPGITSQWLYNSYNYFLVELDYLRLKKNRKIWTQDIAQLGESFNDMCAALHKNRHCGESLHQ